MNSSDKMTVIALLLIAVAVAIGGIAVCVDRYHEDKVDNCILDNLRELKKRDPIAYRYTTIDDLPQLRQGCEDANR